MPSRGEDTRYLLPASLLKACFHPNLPSPVLHSEQIKSLPGGELRVTRPLIKQRMSKDIHGRQSWMASHGRQTTIRKGRKNRAHKGGRMAPEGKQAPTMQS